MVAIPVPIVLGMFVPVVAARATGDESDLVVGGVILPAQQSMQARRLRRETEQQHACREERGEHGRGLSEEFHSCERLDSSRGVKR